MISLISLANSPSMNDVNVGNSRSQSEFKNSKVNRCYGKEKLTSQNSTKWQGLIWSNKYCFGVCQKWCFNLFILIYAFYRHLLRLCALISIKLPTRTLRSSPTRSSTWWNTNTLEMTEYQHSQKWCLQRLGVF